MVWKMIEERARVEVDLLMTHGGLEAMIEERARVELDLLRSRIKTMLAAAMAYSRGIEILDLHDDDLEFIEQQMQKHFDPFMRSRIETLSPTTAPKP